MGKIVEHPNVYSTCIALLDIHGWKVSIEPGPYEKEDAQLDWYTATRDGTIIEAENPLALLGLASIHEYLHPHCEEPYWWMIESSDPNLYEKLKRESLERGFFAYKKRDFEMWKKYVKSEIHDYKSDPSVSVEDRLGISTEALKAILKEYPEFL